MAESKEDSQQAETNPGGKAVGRIERDRLLAEVSAILNYSGDSGQTEKFDHDWIFSNCSFGLGIDPNG
jgi:hypothetical protein